MSLNIFPDINQAVCYKEYITFDSECFICPSEKIETISSFNELERVRVASYINEKTFDANGIEISGLKEYFNSQGERQEAHIKGNVVYLINKDGTVLTSDGNKHLNSYTENSVIKYRLLKHEEIVGKYIIKQVFSIASNIQIGVKISGDIYFDSMEDANKYIKVLAFQDCILTPSNLILSMNDKVIYYKSYDMFLDGKLLNCTPTDFFNYLAANVPASNNAQYAFQKQYRCIPVSYGLIQL